MTIGKRGHVRIQPLVTITPLYHNSIIQRDLHQVWHVQEDEMIKFRGLERSTGAIYAVPIEWVSSRLAQVHRKAPNGH